VFTQSREQPAANAGNKRTSELKEPWEVTKGVCIDWGKTRSPKAKHWNLPLRIALNLFYGISAIQGRVISCYLR
jgi:hypothetical protein